MNIILALMIAAALAVVVALNLNLIE